MKFVRKMFFIKHKNYRLIYKKYKTNPGSKKSIPYVSIDKNNQNFQVIWVFYLPKNL